MSHGPPSPCLISLPRSHVLRKLRWDIGINIGLTGRSEVQFEKITKGITSPTCGETSLTSAAFRRHLAQSRAALARDSIQHMGALPSCY